MVSFHCTLSADAVQRIANALSCLAKFSEVLGIDISASELTLVALNGTKTSSASVILNGASFFQSFHFKADDSGDDSDDDDEERNRNGKRNRDRVSHGSPSPDFDVATDSFGPRGASRRKRRHTSHDRVSSSPSPPSAQLFQCQLFNRSLLSVFKPRGGAGGNSSTASSSSAAATRITTGAAAADAFAGSGIERCEMTLQDRPGRVTCLLVVSMVSRAGVRKTVRLTYEGQSVPRALFKRQSATSHWVMNAHVLKGFTEFFGARTELLDIYSEGTGRSADGGGADGSSSAADDTAAGGVGRASFTSYTEKVSKASGEVLRQPLQTTVDVDTADFDVFDVEDGMHVGVSVRDFRAIALHADGLRADVSAYYSRPKRPLQIAYAAHGMVCEFVLATTGQYGGTAMGTAASNMPPPTPVPGAAASRPGTSAGAAGPRATPVRESRSMRPVDLGVASTNPVRQATATPRETRQHSAMPPPPTRPSSVTAQNHLTAKAPRPPPATPSASVDEQSLFIPDNEDDDRRWDETSYDADEDQLGWNNSYMPDQTRTLTQSSVTREQLLAMQTNEFPEGEVPPTQPMGDMRGLFD